MVWLENCPSSQVLLPYSQPFDTYVINDRQREHVYRKHRLHQFKCNRCCQELKNSIQLSAHQRSEVACEIRIDEPQEGINEEQLLRLRSRKKPQGKLSEEEKWNEAYKVIFPDDDLIPSPCKSMSSLAFQFHDTDKEIDHDLNRQRIFDEGHFASTSTNLLRDLGDHARRELPRLMRPKLEDLLERVIEEGLTTDRVVDLAQGVFQQILQSFKVYETDRRPLFETTSSSTEAEKSSCDQSDRNYVEDASDINIELPDVANMPWMEELSNTTLVNNGANLWDSLDVFDIFQNTVVDSLGNFEHNFDELFRSPGEAVSQPDSGYLSG